jgi:CubicO group peptidase (beta-lactamase class C family)
MKYFFGLILMILIGCSSSDDSEPSPAESIYFPPAGLGTWETTSPTSLNLDEPALVTLFDFLEENDTRAFIILLNGRIVVEEYWGNTITNSGPFTESSPWYWASAGKSLTSSLVGIAEKKGLLSIDDRTSDYLGTGWTSLTAEQENMITIRNQLTMTTGLSYEVPDVDCTDPECLIFKSTPGTQWFYHNAPYTLLESVVSEAAGLSYNSFTDNEIEAITGMNGNWLPSGYNNVYWSTARDAARFGLLIMNNGTWEETSVIPSDFVNQMTSTSQNINPSYGFLWWLNGKESIIYPALATSFSLSLAPSAPAELFAAMGKNGQIIDILPSKGLVIVRMGDNPDNSLVPITFHDEMWQKIMETGLIK